jgi:hypothetical protein
MIAPMNQAEPITLEIAHWSATFETAKTRKLQRLIWYHAPSGTESKGFRRLARQGTAGFAAIGVFQALCQTLATMRKEARAAGRFQNSDGTPMDLEDVWDIARVPPEVGTAALPLLLEIGWICHPSATGMPPASQWEADDNPCSPTDPPPTSLPDEQRRGEDRREGEGSGGEAAAATAADLLPADAGEDPPAPATARTEAEQLVQSCPRPSLTIPVLQAAERCLDRHRATLGFQGILEAVQAITARIGTEWSETERREYVPNAERFFGEDLWRRAPDEWRSKRKPKRAPVQTGGRTFETLDLRDTAETTP